MTTGYGSSSTYGTPTHATKKGVRYRYCASAAEPGDPVQRVPATLIERIVTDAIARQTVGQESDLPDCIRRVDLGAERITIQLQHADPITTPWQPPSAIRYRETITGPGRASSRPMRAETRETLLVAIAKGRRWLAEIVDGSMIGPDAIAEREGSSPRQVARTLSLAHLAPDIVEAAIAGRWPTGIGFRELVDPPLDWTRQRQHIGIG